MQSIALAKRHEMANNKIMYNSRITLGIVGTIMLLVPNASTQCPRNGCVTDFRQRDCPIGTYLLLNQTVDGCCPGCVVLPGIGGQCEPNENAETETARRCAPGLMCHESGICIFNINGCFNYLHRTRPYIPDCLIDGTYAPVQCKGDRITGRCFCSDASGNRIFGTAWRSRTDDMTCACSRRRSELERSGRTSTLHCTSDGSYEPLQCDNGACWCAEPKTGEVESIVVPEHMMEMLPCYSAIVTGSQYLRQCESLIIAQAFIHKEQARHGTVFINEMNTLCDYDGTFGRYQIENGMAFCSARNGSRILSFQTPAGNTLTNTDCNCARDVIIYQESGLSLALSCSGNGNYESRQQSGGRFFCVDRDGFPTTGLADFGVAIVC